MRSLPTDLSGVRDKALLLLGFAGAFRRSEMVAITLGDRSLSNAEVVITVRRSDPLGSAHDKVDVAAAAPQADQPLATPARASRRRIARPSRPGRARPRVWVCSTGLESVR